MNTQMRMEPIGIKTIRYGLSLGGTNSLMKQALIKQAKHIIIILPRLHYSVVQGLDAMSCLIVLRQNRVTIE